MTAPTGSEHIRSALTREDIRRLRDGTHYRLYEKLGAHPTAGPDEEESTSFAVWAPKAGKVSVIGDFNQWQPAGHRLQRRRGSGVWEGRSREVSKGDRYKYRVKPRRRGAVDKADPFALTGESPPGTASIVWKPEYEWGDSEWMEQRAERNSLRAPISIYEMHLGSWKRGGGSGDGFLTYSEIAPLLAEYVEKMGYTHVEFMPVMEHPFYGSWGYQCTGYFSPTRRYGCPEDLMYLIDHLHRAGIGVILDWVPSHFPNDAHSLCRFDGTSLYEHPDPTRGYHPDWTSLIFNYGRPEVRSFLLSSALFWLDIYHADGIRMDAIASMLYLDYSRKDGEWVPNRYGGNENLEAIEFIRMLNEVIYREYPDVQTYAEESTAWPSVTRPTYSGGLGFGLKWDLGWMNDTLTYFSSASRHGLSKHKRLTFRGMYADTENFVLPLSHDEVVYGKGSLFSKMPGKAREKFADLRLLLGYMFTLPGKKLLFMGGEFGQKREWNHDLQLDWDLLDRPENSSLQQWVAALNHLYRDEPALHLLDCERGGFQWINPDDSQKSILSYIRYGGENAPPVVVVCNFSAFLREDYRIGVPHGGEWVELLNSNAARFGGGGDGAPIAVMSEDAGSDGFEYSIRLDLPPKTIRLFR